MYLVMAMLVLLAMSQTYGASWRSVGRTHYFAHATGGLVLPTDFPLQDTGPATPFH